MAGPQGGTLLQRPLRTASDKLYHCWQVDDATALDLRSLNAGHAYWVAVDTFNTNGVTRGTPVPIEETSR
ncbi:hypothetical protein AB0M02_17995 [Actinoplanes sp. NPDC051861]|uniref:hypothetical protein n=1 Tax=Actinoplanes sp. NPDC051861 TaxID=3155170 RepID=UPI0034198552